MWWQWEQAERSIDWRDNKLALILSWQVALYKFGMGFFREGAKQLGYWTKMTFLRRPSEERLPKTQSQIQYYKKYIWFPFISMNTIIIQLILAGQRGS